MIKTIKKLLVLMGIIYLSSLAVSNVTFSQGVSTLAILALLITVGRLALIPVQKTILLPLNKLTLGITGFLVNIVIISLLGFLFKQVQFISFESASLPKQLAKLLPGLSLTGFWSLLPFSAIIETTDRLLNRQTLK